MSSFREALEAWAAWDAYTWSLGEFPKDGELIRPSICGAVVRPPAAMLPERRAIVVPVSNTVLLGSMPGEIEACTARNDVRAGTCIGFPWFEPVWAVPADSMRSDKRTARVLLIGGPRPVDAEPSAASNSQAAQLSGRVSAWCSAIRAAGRKGLQTEPPGCEVAAQWHAYNRSAKQISRRS